MDEENSLKELVDTLRDKLCVTVARGNAVDVKRVNLAEIKRLKTTRRRLEDASAKSNTLAKALAVQRTTCTTLEERLAQEREQVRWPRV